MSLSINFGNRLKQCRKLAGLTQETLAERAGVCSKYIGEIERGRKNPSLDVLQKLASALNIELSDFLSFSEREDKHFNYRIAINNILKSIDTITICKIYKILKIAFDD